uniref:Uncharacterized protein n=1 Tax=Aegilops tauschii TaxID=37682 RepID=N1R5H8_AEGTA
MAATARAVTFDASNTASGTTGGKRFDNAVGLAYSKQVLSDASTFIWSTFNQRAAADRKPVDAVTLVVEDIDGVAFTSGNGIHLTASYLNAKMKSGYSDDFFAQILGKNVQQLWQDYKAKFGG